MENRTTWIIVAGLAACAVALALLLRWAAGPDDVPVQVAATVVEPAPVAPEPALQLAPAPPTPAINDSRRLKTYEDLPQHVKDVPWSIKVDLDDYRLTPHYKLHVQCGFPTRGASNAWEVSEFKSMTRETVAVLADTFGHGSQGCANWHVATQYAANGNHNEAKYHGMLSSLVLDSPVPLMTLMNQYFNETKHRETLTPYALYAAERWPDTPIAKMWDGYIDQDSREQYDEKIAEIRAFAARLEQEELPAHNH